MAKEETRSSSSQSKEAPGEKQLIRRRKFAWLCVFGFLTANFLMTLRFFFPAHAL